MFLIDFIYGFFVNDLWFNYHLLLCVAVVGVAAEKYNSQKEPKTAKCIAEIIKVLIKTFSHSPCAY